MFQASKVINCCVLLFLSLSGFAQTEWPQITAINKPWARWWWMGSAVNKADLTLSMEEYVRVGLGGLEIVPIYGVKGYESQFIRYLSPEWKEMLNFTLREAQRLNLGIDMANGTGWPFGGPWITDKEAAKTVLYKVYELKEGESLKEKILFQQDGFVRTANGKSLTVSQVLKPVTKNLDLQALALDQIQYPSQLKPFLITAYGNQDQFLDITDKIDSSGNLIWKAPSGNWNIYALFQTLHGKMVERAAPGGEGYAVDHFSAAAIQSYLKKFDDVFDSIPVRALFNDSYEVDDARGQADWTPDFLIEFRNRRGYDLLPFLPLLLEKDSSDTGRRIICDYRTTISELLLDNYTLAWHKWARKKGAVIRNQSHGSPANILDLYAIADIPETEGDDVLRFKFASSAANVTGKKLVSSESATWLNEHFSTTLADVKPCIDKFFLGGVNHTFYHGVAYSPFSDPWPGWLFYASVHFQPVNPFWEHFFALNNYIARSQSFLQQGVFDNDILLYYPIYDRFSDPGKELLRHFDGMEREFAGTDFKNSAEYMLNKGYAFDFISDKQLQQVKFQEEKLSTGNTSFQTIIIPACTFMPLETWQFILQNLVSEGATVIFSKRLPTKIPGYGGIQKGIILDSLLKKIRFSVVQEGIQVGQYGKGRILLGNDLDKLLMLAKIRRESIVDQQISFIRKRIGNKNLYFLVNKSSAKWDGWVPLQCKSASVMLFNAMNKQKGLAEIRSKGDSTSIYLQLEPDESILAVVSPISENGLKYSYLYKKAPAIELKGSWNLTFTKGGPVLPQSTKITVLKSWTELGNDDYKYFSGMASYKIEFPFPAVKADKYLLDLGLVNESAEILINDKHIATLIGKEFKTVINASDLKSKNILEIRIANGMANRIIYLEKQGVSWKKFYNINFPNRLLQNKGSDGLFSAVHWEPLPSGLLGPVTLTPLK